MKKQIVIFFFLIIFSYAGKTQEKQGFGCYTDRDVYVSGETVLAKIFTPKDNPSRIVHIDLINKQGTRITGGSMEINNNQADGFLELPDSLSSGTYLLRAYLKNTAAQLKIIREIWITNRFEGLEKTVQMNRATASERIQEKATGQINIDGIAPRYQTNTPIAASIRIDPTLGKEIDGNLLVCIAQTNPGFEPATFAWKSDQSGTSLSENKGVILSGTVTDKKTQTPAPGITVFLTIPDSIPGFQYYTTKNDGHFYFLLDKYYGPVEAVVQCFGNNPEQRLKLTLEDHLSKIGDLPKFTSQNIPEDFKNSLSANIEAITLQKIFGQEKELVLAPPVRKREVYPYYGMPTVTVDPKLFIDLPNFNEISKELLHGVKYRNFNNEPTIQVINSPMHNFFEEAPLILLDGIPIRDLNLIKDMSSADIDRVDICQTERYYGDLRFQGVVAIYTKKADSSRIPESDQLIRLNLETIQVSASLAPTPPLSPNIPDLRQIFYWNPKVDPAQTLSVNCTTSSITGKFKLVVRGRLKDGTLIFTEKQFEVN